MTSALVLGIGNILFQDEGVGVRVVEYLEAHYQFDDRVTVIDGGTKGYELVPYLEVNHVLVIDAVEAELPPASVVRLENDDVPVFLGQRLSPHQIGLSDLLCIAKLRGVAPETITLIGVQPAALDVSMELSESVAHLVPLLAEQVVNEMRAWGYTVTPQFTVESAVLAV